MKYRLNSMTKGSNQMHLSFIPDGGNEIISASIPVEDAKGLEFDKLYTVTFAEADEDPASRSPAKVKSHAFTNDNVLDWLRENPGSSATLLKQAFPGLDMVKFRKEMKGRFRMKGTRRAARYFARGGK